MENTPHIGLLTVQLIIPQSHSLKEKRKVVTRVKTRVHNKFNASISEIDNNDKWQRVNLAIVIVGINGGMLEKTLNDVLEFIEYITLGSAEVIAHKINFL